MAFMLLSCGTHTELLFLDTFFPRWLSDTSLNKPSEKFDQIPSSIQSSGQLVCSDYRVRHVMYKWTEVSFVSPLLSRDIEQKK